MGTKGDEGDEGGRRGQTEASPRKPQGSPRKRSLGSHACRCCSTRCQRLRGGGHDRAEVLARILQLFDAEFADPTDEPVQI